MKTNFKEWCGAYYLVLLPYYNSFCKLFVDTEPPSLTTFMQYCFINTKQHFNPLKLRNECYISDYR